MKTRLIFFLLIAGMLFCLPSRAHGATSVSQEYFNKASIQYLLGNYDTAVKHLRLSLRHNPRHAGARKLLESISRERNDKNVLKKVQLEQQMKMADEYMALGNQSYAEGNFAAAAAYFKGVASLDPNHPLAVPYMNKSREMDALVRKDKGPRLFFALISFSIGFISLTALLSYVAVKSERKALEYLKQKKENVCFNCRAKISPTIDLCPNCGAWIGTKMRKAISNEQAKWYAKWGWRKNPFTLDIHPELFTGYRKEVKSILEKINARSGHVLVTGPLGVGKTTLLRWLSSHLASDFMAVYVSRPPQEFRELIKLIVQNMNLGTKNLDDYDVYHLDNLRRKAGKNLVILLDEAHEFTIEIERPLRTLGDLDGVKLVMAGLPETSDKFKNEIRPLYERLVLSIALRRLETEDLKDLIKARIENAGGEGFHPFTADALDKLFELSGGIPRVAVKICDWAVTKAITDGEDKINAEFLVGWVG